MPKAGQLYVNKTRGYHVLLMSEFYSVYQEVAWIVTANVPELKERGPMILAEASIKRSFTLVANNYQPK